MRNFRKIGSLLFATVFILGVVPVCIYLFRFHELISSTNVTQSNSAYADILQNLIISISIALGGGVLSILLLFSMRNAKAESMIEFDKDESVEEEIEESTEQEKKTDYKGIIAAALVEFKQGTSLENSIEKLLTSVSKSYELVQGAFYVQSPGSKKFKLAGGFAHHGNSDTGDFESGEGINGQVVKLKKPALIDNVPEDSITVFSGLGQAKPSCLYVLPVIDAKKVNAVIELAFFKTLTEEEQSSLTEMAKSLGEQVKSKMKEVIAEAKE